MPLATIVVIATSCVRVLRRPVDTTSRPAVRMVHETGPPCRSALVDSLFERIETGCPSGHQGMSGAGARSWRFTRSSGRGAVSSAIVVLSFWPKITSSIPASFITRATVQRATSEPFRRSCRQTLRTPQTRKAASNTRSISGFGSASRRAREQDRPAPPPQKTRTLRAGSRWPA